jgi:leader peptidase (prepilin peptidase)/N-methyltransferase
LEVFGGVIALLITSSFGFTIRSASALTFIMIMILVALIDWRHLLIPNVVVSCGLILALALKAPAGQIEVISASVSGISAFLLMGAIRFAAGKLLRKEAMGFGDVKLSAVIGAFIGFEAFLISLWISSMTGAAYGVYLTRGNQAGLRGERIPFGTFLSLASVCIVFINFWGING